MPSPNNHLPIEKPNSGRKRKLIIGGIIVTGLVLTLVLSLLGNRGQEEAPFEPRSRYDSNSGETVSTPEDKTRDVYGLLPDSPIFLGFDELINEGVTVDQLNSMKYAFYQYGKTAKIKIKEVSLTVASIEPVPHDRFSSSISDKINFQVILDQKTKLQAKLEYWDLTTIRLQLYDASGKRKVYDSGPLKDKSLEQPPS